MPISVVHLRRVNRKPVGGEDLKERGSQEGRQNGASGCYWPLEQHCHRLVTREGDIVRVTRVDASGALCESEQLLIHSETDHVGEYRARRRALRQLIVVAAQPGDDFRHTFTDSKGPEDPGDPVFGDRREEVREIEVEQKAPAHVCQCVRLDGLVGDEAMDRVPYAIELIEQRGDLALQVFQTPIRRLDDPVLALALGDLEPLVHAPAEPPDFIQLPDRKAEVGEDCGFAGQLGRRRGAANGGAESGAWHEVSPPVTPGITYDMARTICADNNSYAAVTTARMRGETPIHICYQIAGNLAR